MGGLVMSTGAAPPALSRRKRLLFVAILCGISVVVALVIAEVIAATLEPDSRIHGAAGAQHHDELGWLPPVGIATAMTGEFTARYDVNATGMNDRPVEESVGRSRLRIVALGDSHTFAVGVSQEEAWPNALETWLFHGDLDAGTVYDAGVVGYSLGQYLVRFRSVRDLLHPRMVLIGFSMATDLYDLVPPRMGGFVYGPEAGRVYFDLDPDGTLVEHRDLVGQVLDQTDAFAARTASQRLRAFLDRFAVYRRLKRSSVAMAIAGRGWLPEGESLWPGPETAMRRELGPTETYRWRLAEAILAKLAQEIREAGAEPVLVNIPYLPQVYDDVWAGSFGARPETFDREVGTRRLADVSARIGMPFVDTTPAMAAETKRLGRWLHFRQDAHPTAEGHRVIAETVGRALVELGLVPPLAAPVPPHLTTRLH